VIRIMPIHLDEVKRYRQISDGLVEFGAGRSWSSIRMSKTMSLSFSRDPLNQVAIEAAFTATAKRVVCRASTPVSPAHPPQASRRSASPTEHKRFGVTPTFIASKPQRTNGTHRRSVRGTNDAVAWRWPRPVPNS
jgi:hypothetical protein